MSIILNSGFESNFKNTQIIIKPPNCQYARQLEGFIFSILVITGYKTVIPEEAII